MTDPVAIAPVASNIVAPEFGRSFLAAIGSPHPGLSAEHARMFTDVAIGIDQNIARMGCSLTVTDDMDEFGRVVTSVGKFLPNVFDRKLKPVSRPGEALGIVIRNDRSEVIGTHAVRLCRLQRSLADHLCTLSMFYANPVEQMVSGEYLCIKGEARRYAESLVDQAVWIGCFWVHPEYRKAGSNVSSFLPLVSRTLSTMRWGYNVVFSLTESWLRKPHAQARIHNPDIYETVEWYRPQLPEAERLRRSEVLLMVTERHVPMLLADEFLAGGNQLWIAANRERAMVSAGD